MKSSKSIRWIRKARRSRSVEPKATSTSESQKIYDHLFSLTVINTNVYGSIMDTGNDEADSRNDDDESHYYRLQKAKYKSIDHVYSNIRNIKHNR